MEIKEGYVYHIKSDYFEFVNDEKLMKNHEGNLIQNMFPIIPKYIDHIDTVNGKALQVPSETRRQILDKVNRIFKLKTKRNKFNISRCR